MSPRERERLLATIARHRHGVVPRSRLLELGFTRHQIQGRVETMRLVPRYRGVYAIGSGRLAPQGEWLAAVDFAGADSLLSHSPALAAWKLRPWLGGAIDVTSPRRIRGPRPLRLHRSLVPRDERTLVEGIPITTTGRTILDMGPRTDVRGVERLINEAHVLGLPIRPPLDVLLRRHRGRRGNATVAAALAAFGGGPTPTKSELEERFIAFLDRQGLPRPLTNRRIATAIGPLRVDCVWPAERLVVELDAYGTHGSRPRMAQDRRRDRALGLAGWRHERLMDCDLDDEASLAADIAALLAA